MGQQMVGEVARGLSLFGGASSEVRRCRCTVVVYMDSCFYYVSHVQTTLASSARSVRRERRPGAWRDWCQTGSKNQARVVQDAAPLQVATRVWCKQPSSRPVSYTHLTLPTTAYV